MLGIDRAAVRFSANTFAAAMIALYVAFALDLSQPYWAMATAYIVSNPLSGAVRSKAVYRLLGTILGAAVAVMLVPALVNTPALLSIAVALWVGFCLTVSLLDRTPRSYLLMLAGYTAAIIAFPSVNQPEAIFDVAVTRVIEIGLGVICATAIHSLIFPRPVGETLQHRLDTWMADADGWALDILHAGNAAAVKDDRRHLAGAASEIHVLSVHLPFDTSRLRETTAVVLALHERMVLLIPLLSGIADRLRVLAQDDDADLRASGNAVALWIEAGADDAGRLALMRRIEALSVAPRKDDWAGLLVESLLVRMAQLVGILGESHALLRHLHDPDRPLEPELAEKVAQAIRRPMHRDLPLALRSAIAAVVAILASCAIWIGTGWNDGAGAAIMAAVLCCLFAALDDPAPAIAMFGGFTLLALPAGAIYVLAVLPAVDDFPTLAAVLMPVLVVAGAVMANPTLAGPALASILGFSYSLALQPNLRPDFVGFLNINLGQYVGIFCALVATSLVRSMGVQASVQRMRRHAREDLAHLARSSDAPELADFAATVVDRLGLLAPKLATTSTEQGTANALSALRDLRVGMNLVALQQLRATSTGSLRRGVDALLEAIANHFDAHARWDTDAGARALLAPIDAVLHALQIERTRESGRGVAALVGLRCNLCPAAPPYAAGAVPGVVQ
jgi:uncharacterized membrane protein YccC